MTPWSLIGLLTVGWSWQAFAISREHYDHHRELTPANALTVRIHLVTGLLLALAYVIQGVVDLFVG